MPIPTNVKSEKRQTARMQVYSVVKEWITYGTLRPGEWINQQELSTYFDVSRIPVREALQMLEVQKLVEIIPSKGTCVTDIDMDNMKTWYQPLAALHGLAAEIAADRITEEQLLELERIDKDIMRNIHAGNAMKTQKLDEEFHDYILQIAGNQFVEEFSETLMTHVRRAEHARLENDGALNCFSDHSRLIQALRAGDKETASEEMQKNWFTDLE